ncbi:2-(1,2-epoxy-1,2-dihydrophenyl)acetyl-CoA isomerase [Gemmatimonadetes bacterium T265]|nr:2-(1,2-epoxy-1,2-dihydrophenyl)acetyl-CoA isomerase [Gemmatimonadetes bacterium T265]
MPASSVLSELADGVLTVTLNRPEVLNSFHRAMAAELQDALARAAGDEAARSVVLTGAGRAFCAGQDLAAVLPASGTPPTDLGEIVRECYNPIVRALVALEKPVVAAVNGVAAGAGANLALACDFVIAAEEASFVQSFVHVGLIPDSGGTFLLPQLVGRARAAQLAMLGEKLPARQALEWGMIYAVVPRVEVAGSAEALARRLAAMATRGIGLTKRGFAHAAGATLERQLAFEEELQREAGGTADYAEGVRAFVEKRKAEFAGR